MRVAEDTAGEAWARLLMGLLDKGELSAPRGKPCHETLGVQVRVDDMLKNVVAQPSRRVNYRFAVAEWLWTLFGRSDVRTIAQYNARMAEFSDDGLSLHGAYGPRIRPQWQRALDRLRSDPDTRQAVIDVHGPIDLVSVTKDVPCTLSLQFLARRDKLHLVVCMRSSDAWLGFPYDVFNFSMLGNVMAAQLALVPGSITMNLGSSHLYAEDREKADQSVRDDPETLFSPRFLERPPAWLEHALVNKGICERRALPWEPWDSYARLLGAEKRSGQLFELAGALKAGA